MSVQNKINRKRFLALTGGAVGATALACCGLTTLGTRQPAVEFNESNCGGENEMSDQAKVLVTYASKCGSTGEIAEAIAQTLCKAGAAVDVRLAKDVTDVSPYRAVIVGSAIRMGRWLPEAIKFVETHQEPLSRVPVAYFLACMTLAEEGEMEENRRTVAAYLDPVHEMVQPVDVGLFAGTMDYGKLPFVFRLIMKAMGTPEGDFRDWEGIRAWADGLHPSLLGASVGGENV